MKLSVDGRILRLLTSSSPTAGEATAATAMAAMSTLALRNWTRMTSTNTAVALPPADGM
jgi:hypothetical protein